MSFYYIKVTFYKTYRNELDIFNTLMSFYYIKVQDFCPHM